MEEANAECVSYFAFRRESSDSPSRPPVIVGLTGQEFPVGTQQVPRQLAKRGHERVKVLRGIDPSQFFQVEIALPSLVAADPPAKSFTFSGFSGKPLDFPKRLNLKIQPSSSQARVPCPPLKTWLTQRG